MWIVCDVILVKFFKLLVLNYFLFWVVFGFIMCLFGKFFLKLIGYVYVCWIIEVNDELVLFILEYMLLVNYCIEGLFLLVEVV